MSLMKAEIVDDIPDDHMDTAIMVCASGPATSSRLGPGEAVDGRCAECNTPIHWSLNSPPRMKKWCAACAFAQPAEGYAVTEQTMVDCLETLGLDDTEENRALLLASAQRGYEEEMRRAKERKSG